MNKEQAKEASLIGKYFHSFKEDSLPKWQGKILAEPQPGFYLVQLFDWIMGDPSIQTVVPIADLIGWHFYDTVDEMTETYDRKWAYYIEQESAKEGKTNNAD